MKFEGIDVSITIGGNPVKEYDVASQKGTKEMTCWVESKAGVEFCIAANNPHNGHGLSLLVKVDGRTTNKRWVNPSSESNIEGPSVAGNMILPLTFSPIQLTDDETIDHLPKSADALGTVQVVVHRAVKTGRVPWLRHSDLDLNAPGPLHERSKKAGTHCVSLGHKRRTTAASNVTVQMIDSLDKPYYTFLFRYRPRDILQAQGIISGSSVPTQPSPEPPAPQASSSTSVKRARKETEHARVKEESESSGSDDETTSALLARLDTMAADIAAVRAQVSRKEGKRAHKRVKREPSPIRLGSSGDFIDLTLE